MYTIVMIDVRNLCIGNWVYDGERTQFPMQVVGIGSDYVYLDFEGNEGDLWESKPEDLQGIPLTPELLEEIGYERPFETDFTHREIYFDLDYDVECDEFYWWFNSEYRMGKPIKYLHELQNQIRMFRKQELKVNLWN